jgi:threonine dehydrogenase-like Zn-dependent dehydrogenase
MMPAASSSPQTMRAARITAPGRIEVENIAIPEPRPSQVRVRIAGCGVCGSNLALWSGRPWFKYPAGAGEPGHEGWGFIDKLGTDVKDLRLGERVALLSGRAFAEYDLAEADCLITAPDNTTIFPGEALGCAMNIFRRCKIAPQQNVAVIGVGFLGALLVQLAARRGARVIAISRRPFALETAKRAGAQETLSLDDPQAVCSRVMELTGSLGCERVIEAAGAQETLDLAGELVRVRGRLIIAGYHQDSPRQVNMQLWNWRGINVINAHERDPHRYVAGMRAAAQEISGGTLDPGPLYSHGFPLDSIAAAFNALEQRPKGFLKAWVYPGGEN